MELARTLLELQREKKWGTLDVDGGGSRTCIYIADGKPVFAEEGTLSDTLGRLLVREGALTPAQYAAILARMTEAIFQAEPMRFGEVAVALGFLTPQQVQESLAAQVQQKVIRCIALPSATFTFRASRDWAKEVGHFPSSVEPLVLHAATTFGPDRVAAILRSETGARVRLLRTVEDIGAAFGLGGAEQRFLATIDGRRSVTDLLATSDVDATSILVALALSEYAVIVDASSASVVEHARAPQVSHADIAVERRKRLVRFTAERGAAKTADAAAARAQAEAALKRVWESRRSAESTALPEKPKSPQEARLLAEAAFQLGVSYLRSNSLERAAQELKRAVELGPSAHEYVLYAKWAEFANEQRKLAPEEVVAHISGLEHAAGRALEQVTDFGFAHYVLGHVYMHRGDDDRALRSFKRAARLDPDYIDAERQVRLIELRKRRSASNEPVAPSPPVPALEAPPVALPAPRPPRRKHLAFGAAVAGVVLVLVVLVAIGTRKKAEAIAAAPLPTHPVVTAQPTAPQPTVSASPTPTPAPSNEDTYGTLQATQRSSAGHRITLDGRALGDAPGPYRVPCGWHTVQLGSHGKPRRVQVECGKTTDLDGS